MGAGCCRARVMPGPGGHHHAPELRPRPVWNDPASIANLRPGDKFHFSREPFIRQHLVVPEKAYSTGGVHNAAFTSDGGGLAVRPCLPSLPTPPTLAPVPPPRKKRRSRPPHTQEPPPMPPSRTRGGLRTRVQGEATAGAVEDGVEENMDPNDSILSPAHTMELLKRMAKVEARLGNAGVRARSMDSLDVMDSRTRSLPGRGARGASQSSLEQSDTRDDGPRSLDLDVNKEGVVGVAAFSIQGWDERRGLAVSPPLSNSAVLLSPRQWRPLSLPTPPVAHTSSAESSRASSPQMASTKALSDFIKDTYSADGVEDAQNGTESPVESPRGNVADSSTEKRSVAAVAAPQDGVGKPPTPSLVVSAPSSTSGSSSEADALSADTRTASTKRSRTYNLQAVDVRPGSSASSTTESLGELEDDIIHMLSSAEAESESERSEHGPAQARHGVEDREGAPKEVPEEAEETQTLSSTELVRRQQQHQFRMDDSVSVST